MMDGQEMMDTVKVEPIVKQEHISRENTPFASNTNNPREQSVPALQQLSRHNTPRPSTPLATHETDIPCSQDTVSTAPIPDTPAKLEEDNTLTLNLSPLVQDSPNNTPSNGAPSRRKKRKSRRGGGGNKNLLVDTVNDPPPPMMNLTHANKQWFDIFQTKQSGASVSTVITDHPPHTHHHTAQRIEEQFNYVKEILSRSLSWTLLPLRWGLHWAAIYVLPFAIALGVLALVVYLIFPRYIFSAIPSIFTTTASVLAFPARMVVVKTPEVWCSVVGIGCSRNNTEGEEVVRNATFATDLEVRNAFTVIHNLNYLNNSSNRLVLDSVYPLPPGPQATLTCFLKVNIHSVGDAALHLS